MTRLWSIGARTTLAFALASMVITAAVLVLVTSGSVRTFASEYRAVSVELRPDTSDGAEPAPVPDATGPGGAGASGGAAVVQLATTTQWQWAAFGIVTSGVLAGCVGWFVSRRVLRPVDRITAITRSLSASTLHERIALDGPDDELRRLARTIDDLLDRLETAFESQRRFVAQASHELRTPLAVQRAALQVGLPDDADPAGIAAVRAELLEQNRRTERLVDSLLVLAEAERGLDGRTEPVDCETLACEVAGEATGSAGDAGIALTCRTTADVVDGLVVTAEPTLVRQLLRNLVANAVEYNRPGGWVEVVVRRDGFSVANSGDVVDAVTAGRLVEPFCRGDRAGSDRHSGLGLSIVAAIARAHGWGLDVRPRAEGGLVVDVRTAVSSA
ncbi:two-component sensor histidine kinase [Curtobacterium sp. MCSS17_008]|uniref:sensor histidine kinase n=1 Tax=Curtobacterium sp. MCSS17_008 TaxID=2175647 RepID=UPI000DA7685B|nr:HAMP domain-containing sensor histidine kinase [Curtobacterium sp. MCSS17_008]PZF57707.1 two-component sensor histidine kinase [Curtobacterium sp. MCSS17_008]